MILVVFARPSLVCVFLQHAKSEHYRITALPHYSIICSITASSLAHLMDPVVSLIAFSSVVSSLPSLGFSPSLPKPDKAFIVGPGHIPIPAKLVKRFTDGQFMELVDLLSVNLRVVEQEPQTFLGGKLLVSSSKRRQMENKDILTWVEAIHHFSDGLVCSIPTSLV